MSHGSLRVLAMVVIFVAIVGEVEGMFDDAMARGTVAADRLHFGLWSVELVHSEGEASYGILLI